MALRLAPAVSAVLLLLAAPTAFAAPAWLIAAQTENATAGAPLQLEIAKPSTLPTWPTTLSLRIQAGERRLSLTLTPAGAVSPDGNRRAYTGLLPTEIKGLVRVELADLDSNRLALLAESPAPGAPMPQAPSLPLPVQEYPDEAALSANEPTYFILGSRGGANARFQLSFKYRLVEPDGAVGQNLPFLRNLHFGYTQTSLWDLGAESKPFRDTSYRPSLFWQWQLGGDPMLSNGAQPMRLRTGYEHESNGKDGTSSRSIDMLFMQPAWHWQYNDGRALILAPKVYGYLDKTDNPDIQRYRGYADWIARYGREEGWMLGAQLRRGTAGYGSTQLDLSYPLRDAMFARTGGFLHFQLFSGYGETLLDYNQRRQTQIRIGFSIVR